MNDLVAFLHARLDETEKIARDALLIEGTGPASLWGRVSHRMAVHLSRQDPAYVLSEVDAKRQILTAVQDVGHDYVYITATFTVGSLLAMLALPYAGHPDYRPEWRP